RAETQVRRLAGLYAVLDGVAEIAPIHLLAALAVWQYSATSVCYVFGDVVGDPLADELLRALREAGAGGLTRNEIRERFAHHRSAADLTRALTVLLDQHLAAPVKEATKGRPAERWVAFQADLRGKEGGGKSAERGKSPPEPGWSPLSPLS